MLDPFTAWSRMVATGLTLQTTWLHGLETLQASQSVIAARTGKLRDAAGAPLQTDVAELARMVPEKIDAFGRSVQAVTRDMLAMQGAWAAQMQRFGLILISGRLPTPAEASAFATQTANYTLGALDAGARLGEGALAPVHRTATANARRLARTGGKRAR